ncbi:MAG: hypothetical protein DMF89_12295 [Acidobacteria bacterium]|nr:MAG: hypothetical protein DMF89_12295 [Acidobacteriota bacterium]
MMRSTLQNGVTAVSQGFLMVMVAFAVTTAPVAGQARTARDLSRLSRTPWGDPDLQGLWTNTTTTPLERPAGLAGKQILTDQERVALDARAAETRDRRPPPGNTGAYNSFWLEGGKASQRTSLVVDPADGRLPYTLEGRKRADAFAATINGNGTADSWEDRNVYERCITRGLPGAMMPGFYNHNYQILQTPGYIVLFVEMIHDARIIPLDGRPHLGQDIRQWLGDSRGHWEGSTLVVETANFTDKVNDRGLTVFGTAKNVRLIERFTRVDGDTIDYQFTVDDSSAFTRPWTASIPMTKIDGPLYEYACHEGNYGLQDILRGARLQDGATDEATKKSAR